MTAVLVRHEWPWRKAEGRLGELGYEQLVLGKYVGWIQPMGTAGQWRVALDYMRQNLLGCSQNPCTSPEEARCVVQDAIVVEIEAGRAALAAIEVVR